MKTQFGRSTIEMLGVLAIIGVLVIGGLWGYRVAMDKYHANKIIHDVQVYHMTLDERGLKFGEDGYAPATDFVAEAPYTYEGLEADRGSGHWEIDVRTVSRGICKVLLEKSEKVGNTYRLGNEYVMAVGRGQDSFALYKGDTSICQNENTMVFFIGDLTHLCEENCDSTEPCYYGTCCAEEQRCGENCCAAGEKCCGNRCISLDCPADKPYDPGTCTCRCPQDANHNWLVENEDGECVCPEGTKMINGICSSFGCVQSGSTYTCSIGGKRCGTKCSADGLSCDTGICDNYCPEGTTFKYDSSKDYWGCWTNRSALPKGVFCMKSSSTFMCYPFEDGKTSLDYRCGSICNLDGTNCTYGDCGTEKSGDSYVSKCATFGFDYKQISSVGAYVWYGCDLGNGFFATWQEGKYSGINSAGYCAQSCVLSSTGLTGCSHNICSSNSCSSTGQAFNTNNNHCCNGTLTCTGSSCTCNGVDCQSTIGAGIRCDENGTRCGHSCDFTGKNCKGVCYDADCPTGLKRKILDIFGVCYREGSDISCYRNGISNSYTCYKGTTICSRACTGFEAAGCTAACQEDFTCPNNGTLTSGSGSSFCSYTGGLKCNILNGSCSINGISCGTGCHVDGSACTTGVCLQSECPAGQLLTYNGSAYVCINPQVSCSGTTCSIAGRQCGTGCQSDGSSCSAGICVQDDCLAGMQLRQATNEYYGCYNPDTGTTCYKYGGLAVCYKDGAMCGSDCDLNGAHCAAGQTCIQDD